MVQKLWHKTQMKQQTVGPFHGSQFLPLVFIPLWVHKILIFWHKFEFGRQNVSAKCDRWCCRKYNSSKRWVGINDDFEAMIMHSSTHSQTFSLPIPLYNSTPISYMISGEWGIRDYHSYIASENLLIRFSKGNLPCLRWIEIVKNKFLFV